MQELARNTSEYPELIARLSRASVQKHADAYADIAWDDPAMRIDPCDPRWEQTQSDPLGAHPWYRGLPQAQRARIGLGLIALQAKRGVEFENVLSRGLLGFALDRPNRSPEFRYAYHELIEEGQHSLMFQELVNRSGFDPAPLAGLYKLLANLTPPQARTFPELFFVYVLAGELPIDQTQRAQLRRGAALHPLLRRIMHIHVSEEARHVCFAERYLAERVPQLSALGRFHIRLLAPVIAAQTARLMLRPPRAYTRVLGIPDRVMREVLVSPAYREYFVQAVRPLCSKLAGLGLLTRANAPLCRLWGLPAMPAAGKAVAAIGSGAPPTFPEPGAAAVE